METRDVQSVQSPTLALPPRTIGVAGTAPPDALAFINLIQQNTASTSKSPGALAPAPSAYSPNDRPVSKDRDDSADESDDSSAANSTSDETQAIDESSDSSSDLPQQSILESTDIGPTDDDAEQEDVIVGEVKVAVVIEDAVDQKLEDGEEVTEIEATASSTSESLTELAGDAQDNPAAVDPNADQEDVLADFDQQLADAAAEGSSTAADSDAIQDAVAAKDKQAADADPELTVSEEGAKLVQEIIAEQQNQDESPTEKDEIEQVRQAQEAAAAALEQEPASDGPSAAEQFAADRREASERLSKTQEAGKEADAGVDPLAEVEATSTPQTGSPPTPGTHAAVAAAEIGPPPTASAAPQGAATSGGGETPSVAEPGLGTAIQRGLQRGLLQNAKSSGDAPPIDTAKQIQLIQRVSQAVRTAQTQGGPIKLRLSPPELGSLRVELEVSEGGMKAKLEAESEAVRKVLLDNLPQLRDRLAELNLRVDSFDVSVGQNGNPQDAGGAFANQQQNSSNQQSSGGKRNTDRAEKSSVETTSTSVLTSDGQLNVMA